jgi:hypothetical protein
LLDQLGVRGRLKQSKYVFFRDPGTKLHVIASPTHLVGGGTMSKRKQVFFEQDGVEAMARLQKQDEEFCRRLRIAIETGQEFCPASVFTEPCTSRPVLNYVRPG